MKVISKLCIENRIILTLDGDILSQNANKVIVDGKEYDFDIAYDMDNTISIKTDRIEGDNVQFI